MTNENRKNTESAHVTVEFITPEDVGPRDWGREILFVHAKGKYTGKILEMKAGTKGGLQYHREKDEAAYLFSGKLLVRYDSGDGTLTEVIMNSGQSMHIPPGAVHQEEALTDCIIFEVSTPVFDDRVRVEKEYGLEMEGGLPTTENPRIE